MTNMLTDTDLTVIEGLDFDPECDSKARSCDKPAAAYVIATGRTCGCDLSAHLCASCLSDTLGTRDWEATWRLGCGHEDFGTHRQVVIIDRIEPLR